MVNIFTQAKYIKGRRNACSLEPPPSILKSPGLMTVAASQDDFQASLGCGACLEIQGSGKPAAPDLRGSPAIQGYIKAIIVDENESLNQGDVTISFALVYYLYQFAVIFRSFKFMLK